jgi:hypothetical protein
VSYYVIKLNGVEIGLMLPGLITNCATDIHHFIQNKIYSCQSNIGKLNLNFPFLKIYIISYNTNQSHQTYQPAIT